jgi:hypothetical protein
MYFKEHSFIFFMGLSPNFWNSVVYYILHFIRNSISLMTFPIKITNNLLALP